MTLVVLVLVLAGVLAWRWVSARRTREAVQVRGQQERLRIQREHYRADRQVQAMAQDAFQLLLEENRLANDVTAPVTRRA